MKTKHTPGIGCTDGIMGGWCPACTRMLRAAPELLEAAKAVLSRESELITGESYLEYRALEKAVSKAEGGGK